MELAADFDDLANIERVQEYHRRELSKRQQALLADQEACRELEAHIARRLEHLLREATLLERLASGC